MEIKLPFIQDWKSLLIHSQVMEVGIMKITYSPSDDLKTFNVKCCGKFHLISKDWVHITCMLHAPNMDLTCVTNNMHPVC